MALKFFQFLAVVLMGEQIEVLTSTNAPSNWTDIAYQWHFYHLIHLAIAVIGMAALTLSLLVGRAKPVG